MAWVSDWNGRHPGETIVICGLGPSLKRVPDGVLDEFTTIGVNDIERHYQPTYLLTVDRRDRFCDDRWSYIEGSKAETHFRGCKWREDDGLDPVKMAWFETKSSTKAEDMRAAIEGKGEWKDRLWLYGMTPTLATILAARMGAKHIVLAGVCLNGHPALSPQVKGYSAVLGTLSEVLASFGIGFWKTTLNTHLKNPEFIRWDDVPRGH